MARCAVLDDRLRVFAADDHLTSLLGFEVGGPRLVDDLRWQRRKLRNPAAHVHAFRIELLALQYRIEDTEIRRRVSAAARYPLPARRVIGQVGVHERVYEPVQGEVPPIPGDALDKGGWTYDMMYSDKPTAFVDWGRAHDAGKALDGLGMLVEQAAESFWLWRGIRPNTAPVIKMLRG